MTSPHWKLLIEGVPVVLPSGIEVKVRPVDHSVLSTYGGNIGDDLLPFIQMLMLDSNPLETFQTAAALRQALDLLEQAAALDGFSYEKLGEYLLKIEDEGLRAAQRNPGLSRQIQFTQTLISQLLVMSEDHSNLEALKSELQARIESLPSSDTPLTTLISISRKWFARFARLAVVSPQLVDEVHPDGGDDQLPIQFLEYEDLQFVYGLLNMPLHELIRFSEKQRADLATVPSGEGRASAAESGAGGESAGTASDGI